MHAVEIQERRRGAWHRKQGADGGADGDGDDGGADGDGDDGGDDGDGDEG